MATNQIKLVVSVTDNSSAALKNIANNVNSLKRGVASLSSTSTTTGSGVDSVNTKLSKTPGLLSRVASGAKSALAVFGGFKLISGIFNKITSGMSGAISRLDTMDLFEKKMAIITHSTDQAAYALDHMKTATKGTAYGLDTAARAVQNFVVRGMTTEAATKSVETWMDAVAVYGNGTNEALTSVINALGKMRSKGTVEMRHINSMINAGINPVQLYAQATGQAAADVQTQLSEKTLRTEEFLAVVENALQTGAGGVAKVTGLAKDMATTWKATFDNMQFAINRGWASLIDGANKLLSVFNKDGLKGVFKSFGVNSENIMTGIGDTMNRAGVTIKTFYDDFLKRHEDAAAVAHNTELINLDIGARIAPDTQEKFKNSFLGVMGNFAEPLATQLLYLANNWAKFKQAVNEGINSISPQLGHLFGTVFGQGVTSASDLLNKFLQWATLKVPTFFSWVQEKLQWLIDNWGTVVGMANSIFHAFLAWQGLSLAERGILGINSALLTLNRTLGFFTGGALQLPTLTTAKTGIENYVKKQKELKESNASRIASASYRKPLKSAKDKVMVTKAARMIDNLPYKTPEDLELSKKINTSQSAETAQLRKIKAFDGAEEKLKTSHTIALRDIALNKIPKTDEPLTDNAIKGRATQLIKQGVKPPSIKRSFKDTYLKPVDLKAQNTNLGKNLLREDNFEDPKYTYTTIAAKPSRLVKHKPINRKASDVYAKPIDLNTVSPKIGKDVMGEEFVTQTPAKVEPVTKRIGSMFTNLWGSMTSGFNNFTNLLLLGFSKVGTAVGGFMTKIMDSKVMTSITGFFGKIGTTIAGAGKAIGAGFSTIAETLSNTFSSGLLGNITSFFGAFMGAVPMIALVTAAVGALAIGLGVFNPGNTLSNGITAFFSNFNKLVLNFGNYAKYMIENFVNGILTNADQLREQGVNLLLSIVTGILTAIPNMLATGIRVLGALVAGIVQLLPTLVYQGFMAMGQFIAGIISAIPDILQGVGNMLMALAEFFLTNLPMFITSGIQLVWNIITGLSGMLGQICNALGDLLKNTWNWIISGEALKTFQDVGAKLVEWMEIGLAKTQWGSWLLNFVGVNVDELKEKMASDGAETATNYTNSLNTTIQSNPIDITSMWNNADISQNNEMAERLAQQAAGNYVGTEQEVLDAAELDTDIIGDTAADSVESASIAGTDVGNTYTQTATDSINAGMPTVAAAANGVSSQLSLTFDSAVVQEQATNFINTIAIVFTEQAPLLYQTTGNIGAGAVNEFIAKVNENLEPAYATAIGLMSFFRQGIDEGFNGVREAISLGVQTMLPILQQVTTTFYNDGQNSVMQYAQGFKDNAELAAIEALAFKTSVVEIIRGIPEAAYGIGRSTIEAFHNGTIDNEETVITDYTELAEKIGSTLETRLGTAFSSVANKVKEESYNMYLGVVQNLTPLDPYLNQLGNSLVKTASDKAKDVYDNVMKQISPLPGDMQTIGQQMMVNLRQGIEDKMQEVVDTTSTLVNALKETFKQGLGIHSPSRFMRWVGQMMLTGLIGGLSLEEIKKWTELIVGDMRSSFDKGTIDPFDTVDFLKDDTVALIGYLTGVDTSNAQASSGQLTWPIPGYQFHVNSPFGNRRSPGNGGSTNHQGVDLMSGHGNPIVAALPGTVSVSGRYFGYGNAVVLEHGNGIQTRYGHFLGTAVSVGQTVQAGQTVGFSDSTGNSTGDHLHFEIRQNGTPVDPVPYLQGAAMSGVMIDPLANTLQTVYSMYQNSIDKLHWRDGMEGLGDVPIMAGAMGANMSTAGSGLIEPDWFKSWTPPAAVSRWTPQVLQALSILGEPASLLKGVLWAINGESGGNPNDINLWDSNAAIGDPTKGLLQIMMANFKPLSQGGWGVEGYTHNIWDPLENILTGLGEMKWKPIYASRGGIAGVINRRLAEGKWSGYAVGTRYVPQDMLAPIHEGEAILPASMNPYTKSGGDYLKDLVSTIFYTDDGLRMDTEGVQAGVVNNNQTINIEAPINVTVEASEGAEQIGNDIAEEIHKALTRAMMVGNAR